MLTCGQVSTNRRIQYVNRNNFVYKEEGVVGFIWGIFLMVLFLWGLFGGGVVLAFVRFVCLFL